MNTAALSTDKSFYVAWIRRHGHWLLTLFVAFRFFFIQSLFFKFTGSPETVYIFEAKLDPWAASLGFPGAFAPGGIFSAKVVGAFELIASLLLLCRPADGASTRRASGRRGDGPGGDQRGDLLHLFTPLGVAVVNTDGSSDGGELFMLACGVWISCALLLWMRRDVWLVWLSRLTGRGA